MKHESQLKAWKETTIKHESQLKAWIPGLIVIEINRLVDELRVVNNRITAPYPPMTGEAQKEHDAFFKFLPSKQTELIKQIEKKSQLLIKSMMIMQSENT